MNIYLKYVNVNWKLFYDLFVDIEQKTGRQMLKVGPSNLLTANSTQLAINWQFKFPPHPTSVTTLPGENRTNEMCLMNNKRQQT